MSWHYLVNDNTGALLSESSAPITPPEGCVVAVFDERQGQTGEVWDPINREFFSPTVPTTRPVTHYEFRRRLTFAERVRLDNYATDPVLTTEQKATILTFTRDFDSAEFIDLNLQDVRDGLAMLESYGLLAAGRAEEIING